MKTTTTLFALFTSISLTFSQLLGVYEFSGAGACPNQDPNATTQLVNSEFDPFSMQNVFCVATQNVFNTKSWNTTAEINLSEYLQFGVHTISCDRLTIDSLIFEYRNTAAGGTPNWYLRSSVDNYSTDLASGISSTVTGMLRDTVVLNPANFSLLADVKFRIYLTNMGSVQAAFRVDNVSFYGSETFVGTVDYYVDNDGDGYGTGNPIASCTNPGGYSLNNLDCDDNNVAINPGTFWYQDNDGDGFGNDSAFEIGCTSTFANPVTNSDDCDDTNPNLNPNTIWYQDLDGDGFGDDNITEMGCIVGDLAITNPVLLGGDCDDTNGDINPNTIWYEDLDQDSYGNSDVFQVACSHTFTFAVLVDGDCDDINPYINPDQYEDECDNDGIDNNCDGNIDEGFDEWLCFGEPPHDDYYEDNDNDGYGGEYICYCPDPGYGIIGGSDDCDDNNPNIYPGAPEILGNGIDENCDGVDGYLSINEINGKTELKIYPNPGTENFFISSNELMLGENQLRIFDINGKVIFESKLTITGNYFMEVPSANFLKGVYRIEIQNEKQIVRANWLKL
jgi:hypothetical protein